MAPRKSKPNHDRLCTSNRAKKNKTATEILPWNRIEVDFRQWRGLNIILPAQNLTLNSDTDSAALNCLVRVGVPQLISGPKQKKAYKEIFHYCNRISMARTSLGPCKSVRDMDSSSH